MTKKEKLVKEIERLPGDLVDEVYDFIAFIKRKRGKQEENEITWSAFSLDSGSFDFWDDPEEVDYSLDDIRERS